MEALCFMFPLMALLGFYTFSPKQKFSPAAFRVDQYCRCVFKGAGRVALTGTYLIRSLLSAAGSPGLVFHLLICGQSGSNYLCRADFV